MRPFVFSYHAVDRNNILPFLFPAQPIPSNPKLESLKRSLSRHLTSHALFPSVPSSLSSFFRHSSVFPHQFFSFSVLSVPYYFISCDCSFSLSHKSSLSSTLTDSSFPLLSFHAEYSQWVAKMFSLAMIQC